MKMNSTAENGNHNHDQIKVSHDEIAQRAWQHWAAGGQPVGRDTEFWLQAEAELFAATQSGRSLEVGARKRARSAKQSGGLPQLFQDMKPAQEAASMQGPTLIRR